MITRGASKRRATLLDLEPDNVVSAKLPPFIPFNVRPSLERIPDDVLLEVVSHLPTRLPNVKKRLDGMLYVHPKYLIPRVNLPRTLTLRALSRTSRLLRSRCLALAWQTTDFWGTKLWNNDVVYEGAIGKATEITIRILKACPYLLPLIRTVTVILTPYQKAKIIPEFAACLATIPNLDTIHVVHVDWGMQTTIKNAFRSKCLPSVRRISLPVSTHEIIRSCPNVEEVACVEDYGDGSKPIQSLVGGNCCHVRILRGVSAPLTGLVNLAPNLTHVSVLLKSDMTPLINFPLLDTIEILIEYRVKVDLPFSKSAALDIEKARGILKGNQSQAEKTVIVTKLNNLWDYWIYEFDVGQEYVIREVIKV